MLNLAGDFKCDNQIRDELSQAGIQVLELGSRLKSEVPTSVIGVLVGNGSISFKFTRAWSYWIVSGDVPLNVAEELYADPIGHQYVRVAGHAGCPPPEDWVMPVSPTLSQQMREKGIRSIPFLELVAMCRRGELDATLCVQSYHIDRQEGLNLFAATIKKHGLAA